MNSELNSLYQEVILDHNRKPRNFGRLEGADRKIEGYNPLCGDHYTFYLKLDGDMVTAIAFEGSGCAISKASASMMSTIVKGKKKAEFDVLFERFHNLVTGHPMTEENAELGKLEAFSGVSEFPARVKCATLAWHTLKGALEQNAETISTE